MNDTSRRDFLKFMGRSSLYIGAAQVPFLSGCFSQNKKEIPFLTPTQKDDLVLSQGLQSRILISWNEPINQSGDRYGDHNDFIAFLPLKQKEALLWVNHEALTPLFVSNKKVQKKQKRTKKEVDHELYQVGGSFLKIKQDSNKNWNLDFESPLNRRIHGKTPFDIVSEHPIRGTQKAIGTMGNCSGGITPWGSILTCEEGYEAFWGKEDKFGWKTVYSYPEEHYGWVCEIDPKTNQGRKLTALGRFAHECAYVKTASNGRPVVYSGDDEKFEHLYKFISDSNDSLDRGTLYVANLEKGQWIPLHLAHPKLKGKFKNQTELLIHTRKAAKLVGATPLDRPEDIKQDPVTKDIFVSLTNNKDRGNAFGSLLRISENNQDPLALEFKSSTFSVGGKKNRYACPDNFTFDQNGNLWLATDISGGDMNRSPYESFKNNGIFYIPLSGKNAGIAHQIASAPNDAEFTGLTFSPDQKTLFVSVQHPGEKSKSLDQINSHWPRKTKVPQSSLVTLQGPLLDQLTGSSQILSFQKKGFADLVGLFS